MPEAGSEQLKDFFFARYQVVLEAGEQGLLLPPYKGSTLRGGFGRVFRRIACSQRQAECPRCLLKEACPYAYIFETSPPGDAQVLKNLEAVPRPFILEPPLETKAEYRPGESLIFGLVLVGRAVQYLPYFIVCLDELGREGIGKGRRPYTLREVRALDRHGAVHAVFSDADRTVRPVPAAIRGEDLFARARLPGGWTRLGLEFLTPTRLKHQDRWANRADFHVLIRALLRRLSSLAYFHHGWEWQADFTGLIARAEAVTTVREQTRWVDWERYSARQEARIALGGLVGPVVYEGDLAEFLPFILLGEHVHVGKGAVFGMGWYTLAEPAEAAVG
ncbi:MAG: CRISPR system precrRNA processing endoribonuclease RAMP protein Cas6 [Thermoanaerobacterales bacterium]|nr:CRISPR system precrRNA processing endoribonuclease RAMP protein Cas6 [Bacillota bacterium]MDI6907599.1 CRISPR system precrRNA processing endoribonuclease RAMP protein Cas6 [Thermoanaerobacterales bacterium]